MEASYPEFSTAPKASVGPASVAPITVDDPNPPGDHPQKDMDP